MSETGADARTVQSFSDDKSKKIVFRYTHAREFRVDDALEKWKKRKQTTDKFPLKNTEVTDMFSEELYIGG